MDSICNLNLIKLILYLKTWFDYKMRWSPEEYGGITDIRFPHDGLWRPDILLFNRNVFINKIALICFY